MRLSGFLLVPYLGDPPLRMIKEDIIRELSACYVNDRSGAANRSLNGQYRALAVPKSPPRSGHSHPAVSSLRYSTRKECTMSFDTRDALIRRFRRLISS
jgi:hypothetical protein